MKEKFRSYKKKIKKDIYHTFKNNIICALFSDIFIIYLILLWESIATMTLIQNNFLGVVYKDFNCNNWEKYLSNVNPDIKKHCSVIDEYCEFNVCKKRITKHYFEKNDNISISYPNKWVLNYDDFFDPSYYCDEFLETEKDLENSAESYQELLKLNTLIEKKFQKDSKKINEETKKKINNIIIKNNAK